MGFKVKKEKSKAKREKKNASINSVPSHKPFWNSSVISITVSHETLPQKGDNAAYYLKPRS